MQKAMIEKQQQKIKELRERIQDMSISYNADPESHLIKDSEKFYPKPR